MPFREITYIRSTVSASCSPVAFSCDVVIYEKCLACHKKIEKYNVHECANSSFGELYEE